MLKNVKKNYLHFFFSQKMLFAFELGGGGSGPVGNKFTDFGPREVPELEILHFQFHAFLVGDLFEFQNQF